MYVKSFIILLLYFFFFGSFLVFLFVAVAVQAITHTNGNMIFGDFLSTLSSLKLKLKGQPCLSSLGPR